jgi:hypothetical protein
MFFSFSSKFSVGVLISSQFSFLGLQATNELAKKTIASACILAFLILPPWFSQNCSKIFQISIVDFSVGIFKLIVFSIITVY